ncbi:Ig-like domain-containing protein, partial [Mesorhizobium sp. CC13]|uniref:Ig-like domain-containing protein n=1 Tax=Mesorhizobium sp. CC13 TaxID=3029194 RepID=UPI0032644C33
MATTGSQFGNNSGEIEGGLALSGNGRSGGGNELLVAQAEGQPQQQQPAAQAEPVPVDAGSGQPAQAPQPQAAAPTAATPTEYAADASNVVRLPANVSVDNIRVDGANLVLEQADGSVIVIKDAAANVPTFILGDVELPRVALIAALESAGVDVAFGPDGAMSAAPGSADSSGGNFEAPVGGIGDGFDLSALLPPTALQFPEFERRELFPTERPDRAPEISDLTPALEGGDVTVYESALLASRGQGESAGSDAGQEGASQSGDFTVKSEDGIASLTVGGVEVIKDGVFTPTVITTGLGNSISIDSYDPSTGKVVYTYTLVDNEQHADGDGNNLLFEDLEVSLVDQDGDVATGTLSVKIVDDLPEAADDGVTQGSENAPIVVDVLANDDKGADGVAPSNVALVANTLASTDANGPGTLVLNANGSFSYTPVAGEEGTVTF